MKNILAFVLFISTSLLSHAQLDRSTIKVIGSAQVHATPEITVIHIPISRKDASYEATQTKLIAVFNDLTTDLIEAGIKKESIKSDQLRVAEDYKYEDRTRKLVGYEASIRMEIEMDGTTKNLQAVMGTLSNEKYNFGYDINYRLSESQKENYLKESLEKALADAKNKAKIISDAMDLKLSYIYEVDFDAEIAPRNPFLMRYSGEMEMAKSDVSENLELNPREMEIDKTVHVTWLTEPK